MESIESAVSSSNAAVSSSASPASADAPSASSVKTSSSTTTPAPAPTATASTPTPASSTPTPSGGGGGGSGGSDGSTRGGGHHRNSHLRAMPKDPVLLAGKTRILLLCDVRGQLSIINEQIARFQAEYVICTGSFGFFDDDSPKTVHNRHLPRLQPRGPAPAAAKEPPRVGEFPQLLRGEIKLAVPIYVAWGAQEDVRVVGKLRSGEYSVPNLYLLDELNSHLVGNLRLFGLGGGVEYHKLLNAGEGTVDSIAGAHGLMWTTLLQIGELLRTAAKVSSPTEMRLLVTSIPALTEGLIAQVALALKADVCVSDCSGAPFSTAAVASCVQPMMALEDLFECSRESVHEMYEMVKDQVKAASTVPAMALIESAIEVSTLKPSIHFYRDVVHVGLSSSRRLGSAMLLTDASTVGFELFHPGCNFQQRRQYTASTHHQQRVSALKMDHTVIIRPAAPWPKPVTVGEVTSFLRDIPTSAVVITEDVPDIFVELKDSLLEPALRLANQLLGGCRVTVTPMRSEGSFDSARFGGRPDSGARAQPHGAHSAPHVKAHTNQHPHQHHSAPAQQPHAAPPSSSAPAAAAAAAAPSSAPSSNQPPAQPGAQTTPSGTHAQAHPQTAGLPSRKVCRFDSRPGGCREGSACAYVHAPK